MRYGDVFDTLCGKSTEGQIADQELMVEEIDAALHVTRNRIQDVRDRGGRLTEDVRYWLGGADRARSVDLGQLHDTEHEQLTDRDRRAARLALMYTFYREGTKPPSGLRWADFVNEYGETLGLN